MYPVEIIFSESTEDALTAKMTAMREWLDHRRFEPASFRHTFNASGLLFEVYFKLQAEAEAFAIEFGGRSIPAGPEAAID